jgi:hypothetical protein
MMSKTRRRLRYTPILRYLIRSYISRLIESDIARRPGLLTAKGNT